MFYLSLSGSGIYCMDINENMLVCGGGDNRVSLWEFRDNDTNGRFELNKKKMLTNHTGPVNCVQFSSNGDLIGTGSIDKVV